MTLDDLAPHLNGPTAALIISIIANWWQAREKTALIAVVAKKDIELATLTREAVASIATLSTLNQANQRWQEKLTESVNRCPHNNGNHNQ